MSLTGALPGPVQIVADALSDLGATGFPQTAPASLGPGEIITDTEVLEADHRAFVVVCAGKPDPIDLAGVLGVMEVRVVPAAVAALLTGQEPGAIAPIGHAEPMNVVIDINLAQWRRMWVPAGSPGWVFPTTYSELLRITAGSAAEVGKLP